MRLHQSLQSPSRLALQCGGAPAQLAQCSACFLLAALKPHTEHGAVNLAPSTGTLSLACRERHHHGQCRAYSAAAANVGFIERSGVRRSERFTLFLSKKRSVASEEEAKVICSHLWPMRAAGACR